MPPSVVCRWAGWKLSFHVLLVSLPAILSAAGSSSVPLGLFLEYAVPYAVGWLIPFSQSWSLPILKTVSRLRVASASSCGQSVKSSFTPNLLTLGVVPVAAAQVVKDQSAGISIAYCRIIVKRNARNL